MSNFLFFLVIYPIFGIKNWNFKEKIEKICRNNLDDMAIPYEYVYMEELPLNAGGKVNIPLLKSMYEEKNSLKLKK